VLVFLKLNTGPRELGFVRVLNAPRSETDTAAFGLRQWRDPTPLSAAPRMTVFAQVREGFHRRGRGLAERAQQAFCVPSAKTSTRLCGENYSSTIPA
jgi:hypothetical protein